jgi:hypothetical protein
VHASVRAHGINMCLVDVVYSSPDPFIFEVIEGAVLEVLFDPRVACGMPDKDEVDLSFVGVVLVVVVVLDLLVMVVSVAVAVVILRGVDVVVRGRRLVVTEAGQLWAWGRGEEEPKTSSMKYLVLTGFSSSMPSSYSASLSSSYSSSLSSSFLSLVPPFFSSSL